MKSTTNERKNKVNMKKLKYILGVYDMKDWRTVLKQWLAEFAGTFLLLSLALLANTDQRNTAGDSPYKPDPIIVAIANGILVGSIVQIFSKVSGGHINPAVTVGATVYGDLKLLKAIIYITAQICGSAAGAGVAYVLTPSSRRENLGAIIPHVDLSIVQIFFIEFLMTFVLISVVLHSMNVRRTALLQIAPLYIGLCMLACACCAGGYTGCMNPVRSFGPAVVMGLWDRHYLYWAAPLSAAIFAGLISRFIFTHRRF